MFSNYTYLIGSLFVISIWLVLFWRRKDTRKEMLLLSSIIGISGLLLEYFIWTKDWWRPITFRNTIIGIEDLLFGFGIGGIAAVVYEEIFKQKLRKIRGKKCLTLFQVTSFIGVSILLGVICFYYFELNSFISSILSMFIPTLVIWYLRKDLIVDSVFTAFILLIITFVGFGFMNLIDPGFIYKWWLFEYLSGIIIWGVPVEDIIWFFAVGLFVAPFYEFWQCKSFINIRNYN